MKTITLPIENEFGVRIGKVQGAAEETGAFHFVRTWGISEPGEMTGSCYLEMEQRRIGDKFGYMPVGKPVELNEENGYQAAFSTAALGWTPEPDTDYSLRWTIKKPKEGESGDGEVLAVAYEDVHTEKAHITLERTGSSVCRVTLAKEDVDVLEKYKVEVVLSRYIKEKGAQTETGFSTDYRLTAENNYSDTYSFAPLKADTEYEVSVRNRTGEKVYASVEFRTEKDTKSLTVTQTDIHVHDMRLHYALSGFDRYSKDYVVCYYRPAGVGGAWINVNDRRATSDGFFELQKLKENTTYEYALGIGAKGDELPWLTHTVRGSVTTRTDTRRIEVSVTSRMTSAQIRYHMFDMGVNSQNTVDFLFREKGQEQWEKKAHKRYEVNEAVENLSLAGLKEDTVYEYHVGYVVDSLDDTAGLEHGAEGEFRTASDRRYVDIVTEPKSFSAGVRYTLSSMEGADAGYLLGYCKKVSGAEDTVWEKVYAVSTDDKEKGGAFVISGLKEETAYELIMGFGSTEDAGADGLRRGRTVGFATLPDSRRLSDASAEVADENVILRAEFSGNSEKHASYVHFFYRVKGESAYKKAQRVVNMSGVTEDTAVVTLSGLLKGTTYEFAVVLTNVSQCGRPEEVDRDAYKTFGSFTTEEALKPTVLKLSHEQLFLNVNALYAKEKGIGYENLKVKWEPIEADVDFVWRSSDETVVKVTEDGKVSAVAAGKAQITVTSVYAAEITASCEVTVGDYQIGRKGADGSVSYFSTPGMYRIRINKNRESSLKAGQRYRLAIGLTLKMENGDTVKVQTQTFTIRPKQSVPKVTVHGGDQTLYAGNDSLTRTCGFELPDGAGYRIKGLSGGLDCNRDGKQDISISMVKENSTDRYAAAELTLTDRDGALTVSGMKGKSYKVPVTITLMGRDGIAKDVKTSIKVTIRR